MSCKRSTVKPSEYENGAKSDVICHVGIEGAGNS